MKYIVRWATTRVALTHLPAFVLFVVITLVMSWPYAIQVQTSLYNWSDALLNTWTLAWGTHALLTDPLNLYNANIFYPYVNTLAYSESLLPQTAIAMPIILATNMPALAHNLLALSSFVFAASGAYLLVFDLTRSRSAGLVAGMIYTFTSYKMMHFAHLQLLSSQWLPFALLYLHRIFVLKNEKGGIRNAILFAFFFSLQALSSFYYAFFMAIAAALYIAYVLVVRMWKGMRYGRRWPGHFPLSFVVPLGVVLVLIALITIPLSLPYFSVQRELGLERGTADVEYYAATLRTYFSVPDSNWLYSKWLAPKARLTGSGERDFVGFVALGLAFVGLLTRPRRDAEKWFYILLVVVGVVLSLGARNEILLFPKWPKISLPFHLPFRYLFEWVPGFKAMRGPDRFAYLAVLGIAVLAGYGTRAWLAKMRTPRLAAVLPLILIVLIGLENIAIPIRATNPATLARSVPEFAQFIAQQEPDAIVLELPMIYNKESLAWPQYYSIFHWRPLVNGFSGFFPPGYDALTTMTREFPSQDSLALLEEIGVRMVIVHNALFTPEERVSIQTRVAQFEPRVQRVASLSSDDVYKLNSNARAWGQTLAQIIPNGSRVWLNNARPVRREFFEIAAAFLRGRELYGDAISAYRTLAQYDAKRPADFVIVNTGIAVPVEFTRRVWANDYLAVYARE